MPFIQAGVLNVYYEQGGAGADLLFVSGTGGDLRNTPNVLASPLTQTFHVTAYDQRGLGQTDKPAQDYSMADYADDAAALIEALELPAPIPVMGASFGGMVAQELVLRHPHLVHSLVLACTSSGGAGGASFPLHEIAELPDRERLSTHLAVADLRRDAAWQSEHPEKWDQLIDLGLAALRPDRDQAGAARQLAARAAHDTFSRLGEVQVPVLLAAGRYDGVAPLTNQEAMLSAIPGAQLRVFEGGHMFLVQDKLAYPDIVRWITNLGAEGS